MSRTLERRLGRLEASVGPKVLGYFHVVYATDMADYERQKAALIASGRAKPTDLVWDANWQPSAIRPDGTFVPAYHQGPVQEPETHPWTKTWEEQLREWDEEEAASANQS